MEAATLESPQVLGARGRMTAEEFYAECRLKRAELVDGEVVEKMPPGFDHGNVAGNIYFALRLYARKDNKGRVSVEGGFRLSRNPDVVRSPDVSFVEAARLVGVNTQSFIEGPPTLAVEVVSPGDLASEVEAKVREYLAAGVPMVWVVYPEVRAITVRTPGSGRAYGGSDTLSGEPVLPGFEIALGEIFDW